MTVSPGVTTGELAAVFLHQGVDDDTRCCFLSNVVLGTVTYGGIVATGCHVSAIAIYGFIKVLCEKHLHNNYHDRDILFQV